MQRFCQLTGYSAKGTRVDMLMRLRAAGLTRAKFNHAYSEVISHSGGWLSGTCQHNVTYAVKFLLRAESPRDYIDIFRSMSHIPTVNVIDIAHSVAKMGNRIQPGMFQPHDGRVTSVSEENIAAAKEGRP